jgi:hypothetical protein
VRLLLLSLALLSASCAGSRTNAHVGYRNFPGDDWEPVEDQGVLGLEYVHEAPGSAVGIEAAFFASEKNEDDAFVPPAGLFDFRMRTAELSFGVHKELSSEYRGVHPYVGGGLSLLRAELRGEQGGLEEEEDGDSTGAYVHGGVEFDASPVLYLGIDLRVRGGTDVDLLGEDRWASYGQITFVIGVRF